VEPDYGLLDDLGRVDVLTPQELANIHQQKATAERTGWLLKCVAKKTEEQCQLFLQALDNTSQTHVVNFINGNGG
jgi:hypothetical protein